jgi:phosphoglycerol transferase MdoB-like AlkP superfamily enzyme
MQIPDQSGILPGLEPARLRASNQLSNSVAPIPLRALEIFLFHFLFVMLVQAQNASSAGVSFLNTFLAQFDNYLISLVFSLLYLLLRRNTWATSVFYLLYFSTLAAILVNQVHYKIFHEQFSLSQADGMGLGDFHAIWDSFLAEFGGAQIANLAIVVIAATYVVAGAVLRLDRAALPRLGWPSLQLLVLPAIVFGYFQYARDLDRTTKSINSHLFAIVWSGFGKTSDSNRPEFTIDAAKIYQLKYGVPYDNPIENQLLQENLRILQQRKKNIVFIILESVGSKQFLRNGLPTEDATPFLHSQKGNSVIFSDLHNTFPASTRSHVALATGGLTVTWGSVYDQLVYPYTGQTLVSAFNEDNRDTALFSADNLNYENMHEFYRNLGFDSVYYPALESKEFRARNAVHSWGIDEKVVIEKAAPWMKSATKPFFLNLLTIITHHPYGVPASFKSPFQGTDNASKYKSALYYTDNSIEYLVKKLEESNLAKDTLLFIIGDHGEAFGDLHKNNFVHRNYLYEENIRNFLMIVDLEKRLKPMSSSRRGATADVMPTILATQGIAAKDHVIGQNLLSGTYTEKITYFHKSTEPEQWGLRDGEWKFIVEQDGKRHPELYNLNNDPDETTNLVEKHRDRVDTYVNMISNWIVYLDSEFVKRLDGYEKNYDETSKVADLGSPGPKRIAVGRNLDDLPFLPLNGIIHPEEDLHVRTEGLAYPDDVLMEYVVTSPSGNSSSIFFKHLKGWTKTYLKLPADNPREQGLWKVSLLKDHKEVISTSFTISRKARLHWSSFDKTPGIRELFFGFMPESGDFEVLKRVNPMEKVAAYSRGIPFDVDKTIYYTWISPSGSTKTKKFEVKSKWMNTWVYLNQDTPMEEGLWRVILSYKGKLLLAGSFEVSKDAALNIPVKLGAREHDKSRKF